jgi:hypothetical protein
MMMMMMMVMMMLMKMKRRRRRLVEFLSHFESECYLFENYSYL